MTVRFESRRPVLTNPGADSGAAPDAAKELERREHAARMQRLQPWWVVSSRMVQKKLNITAKNRCLFEVGMFVYMGVAKKALSILWCREVEGRYYHNADMGLPCEGNIDAALRIAALVVVVVVVIGFPGPSSRKPFRAPLCAASPSAPRPVQRALLTP